MTGLNSNDWLIYPFGFDPYILTAESISNTFAKGISVYLKIRINNILIGLNSIHFPEYPCVSLKEQYCLMKKKDRFNMTTADGLKMVLLSQIVPYLPMWSDCIRRMSTRTDQCPSW